MIRLARSLDGTYLVAMFFLNQMSNLGVRYKGSVSRCMKVTRGAEVVMVCRPAAGSLRCFLRVPFSTMRIVLKYEPVGSFSTSRYTLQVFGFSHHDIVEARFAVA